MKQFKGFLHGSCGNQISAWPKNSSNSSSSKWFLHGSCGNQISTWPMWKSDFFSLVQLVISRIFWKCMEIFQWPSLILTHTGIIIYGCPLVSRRTGDMVASCSIFAVAFLLTILAVMTGRTRRVTINSSPTGRTVAFTRWGMTPKNG